MNKVKKKASKAVIGDHVDPGEDDIPPLPPGIPGLEYGKTKPVIFPEEPFMQPGEICSLQEILVEERPKPPKAPTVTDKIAWRVKQAKALAENPRADPRFAMLPKGLNNKIDSEKEDKKALPERIRRIFSTPKTSKIKQETKQIFRPVPLNSPAAILTPSAFAVPPRRAPIIAPNKLIEGKISLDEWNNPYSGEMALFKETEEERAARISQAERGRSHRQTSNHYSSLLGKGQINDARIGRPPAISRLHISEPLKLTEGVTRIQQQMQLAAQANEATASTGRKSAAQSGVLRVPSRSSGTKHTDRRRSSHRANRPAELATVEASEVITENDSTQQPPLPEKDSRYFRWDDAMLSGKTPVLVSPVIPPPPEHAPPPIPSDIISNKWSAAYSGLGETPFDYFDSSSETGSHWTDYLPLAEEYQEETKHLANESSRSAKDRTSKHEGPKSPFDSASDERRKVWQHTEACLVGQVLVSSPSFSIERLHAIAHEGEEGEENEEGEEGKEGEENVEGKENEENEEGEEGEEFVMSPLRTVAHGRPDGRVVPSVFDDKRQSPWENSFPSWTSLQGSPPVRAESPVRRKAKNHFPPPPIPGNRPVRDISGQWVVQDPKQSSTRKPALQRTSERCATTTSHSLRLNASPSANNNFTVAVESEPLPSALTQPGALLPQQFAVSPTVQTLPSAEGLPPTISLPPRPPPTNRAPRPPPSAVPPTLRSKDSWKPFLETNRAVSGARNAKMDSTLQVRPSEFSSVKAKAVEDARQMQATVIELASKAGKDPPKYALLELIGKGSFGRVYKGKDMTSAAIVAVKIIDIDESDTLNPRNADSYADFLKEVNALKILSESNARNINHVIEALPVGQSMWMISEYCGGGSIATLMKPTAPGGLQEKWIIPILREVAEAIRWVHQAGIIHRDIKCANVLITEAGGVQLADFGVAGIIENNLDKRSTVIGTPHWMAPELFSANPSYGKEVDIWAFGSLVYEIATGLPPNVAGGIPYGLTGSHLQHQMPRLEGDRYSKDLRSLVAYCLEELPSDRPTIEQVQNHPYIYDTSSRYPASSLSNLVRAFKIWEDHGGSRKSLFMLGGAQGPTGTSTSAADVEWNFSTTAAFDQEVLRQSTPQDVFEAYGKGVSLQGFFSEETPRPTQKASRRRPPPEALARLPAPLEKIFDPNTLSNYEDNSRNHYGRPLQQPASDLPLRDDTAQTSIRDTMIDLGGHDSDTGLSNFPEMDTIKANRRGGREESEDEYISALHDFSRPALSDPADINPNRRTQDWKFPTMAPPASANPEVSRFPISYELPRQVITPALFHHPPEPVSAAFAGGHAQQASIDRLSTRESLIDLDMSLPDTIPLYSRPSTANSDADSATSEQITSGNPFELERHASLYAPHSSEITPITHSELFAEDPVHSRLRSDSAVRRPFDITEISDFSGPSDTESSHEQNGFSDAEISAPQSIMRAPLQLPGNQPYTFGHFPDLPAPPSEKAMTGNASREEMKDELTRLLGAMCSQLTSFRDVYGSEQITSRMGPPPSRRDRRDGAGGDAAGVTAAAASINGQEH